MTTLIIHHLEPMWNQSLVKMSGKDCFEWCLELADFLSENSFDQVILTQFENFTFQDDHYHSGLSNFVTDLHDYAYGWESESLIDVEDYIEGGSHSQAVYTPSWIKSLKGRDVTLCGAFDGECIEDMEIALTHCVGNFKRLERFIV